MRRLLLLVPALLVAATLVWLVAHHDDGASETVAPLTADIVPFPNGSTPLPVPEVHIAEGPWADPLPTAPAQIDPSFRSAPTVIPPARGGGRCGPTQIPVFQDGLLPGRVGVLEACDVSGHR